jgi:hypothetical protein
MHVFISNKKEITSEAFLIFGFLAAFFASFFDDFSLLLIFFYFVFGSFVFLFILFYYSSS